jgi:synaptobrevin family protein YKT6
MSNNLLSLIIFNTNNDQPLIFSKYENLYKFSFFTRRYVREFIIFTSREITKRITNRPTCTSHTIKDTDINVNFYSFKSPNGYSIVLLTIHDYNQRIAFELLDKINNLLCEQFNNEIIKINNNTDVNVHIDTINNLFTKYQNPNEVDKILIVKDKLDDVKELMIQNIDKLLIRGEKIEDLIEQSNDLSNISKGFSRETKKLNRCCIIS